MISDLDLLAMMHADRTLLTGSHADDHQCFLTHAATLAIWGLLCLLLQ